MKMMDLIYGDDPSSTLIDFIRFSCEQLGIDTIPDIKLINHHIKGKESNSFAAYSPNKKSIYLYTNHRHILDVLRSLAHELVHYRQDLNGELVADSGKTGSPQEDEANSIAGQIMRRYSKKHPELF